MTWYANSAGRHGATGAIGDAGERLVKKYFLNKKYKFEHCNDPYSQVVLGIDFIVNGYYIDVKTNGKHDTLTVEIDKRGDPGWLYKSSAEFIFGVDINREEIYVYRLSKMREYVEQHKQESFDYNGCTLIKVPKTLSFIKRLQ
jgi:hypothetical protein